MINGRYISPAYKTGVLGPKSTVTDDALRDYTEAILREAVQIVAAAVKAEQDPVKALLEHHEITE